MLNVASDDAGEGTCVINLSGTVTAPPALEITLLVGSNELASGGTLNLWLCGQGNSVDRTVTIRNDGNSTLTLTAINAAKLPAGYSLISNIGSLQLGAGETTTFTLRLSTATPRRLQWHAESAQRRRGRGNVRHGAERRGHCAER